VSDPVKDLKRELVAAADRRHAPASVPGRPARRRRRLARSRLLVGAATVSIAAAVALVFTAPWSESPTLLERAEAALAPRDGTILHEKWEVTVTSTDPACTVTRGPNEIWIDQASPYRFRALLDGYPLTRGADPRTPKAGLNSMAGLWSGSGSILRPIVPIRTVRASRPTRTSTPRPSIRFEWRAPTGTSSMTP
jgi:hypothetical protein